jgi:hypothetical protein
MPFLLPPDWDGWPLNFTITHFLNKSTHVEFKTLSTVEPLTPKNKKHTFSKPIISID